VLKFSPDCDVTSCDTRHEVYYFIATAAYLTTQ